MIKLKRLKKLSTFLKKFREEAVGYSILVSFCKQKFFINYQERSLRFGLGFCIVTFFNYDYEVFVNNCQAAMYYKNYADNIPKRIYTSRDLNK